MKKTSTYPTASNRDANVIFFALIIILATLAVMVVSHSTVINLM